MSITKVESSNVYIQLENHSTFPANDVALKIGWLCKRQIPILKMDAAKQVAFPAKYFKDKSCIKVISKYSNEDLNYFSSSLCIEIPPQYRRT